MSQSPSHSWQLPEVEQHDQSPLLAAHVVSHEPLSVGLPLDGGWTQLWVRDRVMFWQEQSPHAPQLLQEPST